MANNFDPSIYGIHQTINDIAKMYIPNESQDTLALGLFGYIADIASLQIQNDIIINSELGNELWPSRAKYEKNVIAHSIIQDITDINAKPAVIRVFLGIEEEKVDKLFISDKFIIDKDYTFRIGKFDFHLEYDLILQRSKVVNQKFVYSAHYDMSRINRLSSITNPYTETPYIQIDQSKRMIYIPCQLMQVTHTTEHKKIITSSSVDNKTFEFTFIDQLADFEVVVYERDNPTYLTPVFDGAPIENGIDKYCYYTYIDAQTIRIRFDSLSYLPKLNSNVEVLIKTTRGEEGNFEHDDILPIVIKSDRFNYNNLSANLRTANESKGGENRKTVEELRRLLPKEALSRGSITNTQDLQNFFNTMILDSSKLRIEVMKKISNDFEKRSYYAYLLMKDERDNVVPTNTINIEIAKSSFDTHDNRKYVLKPGSYIVYQNNIGRIYQPDDPKLQTLLQDDTVNFIYTVPYMLVVNADPLYVSYYLTIMNYPAYLTFEYINENSPIQFISTYVTWTRKFLTDSNKYLLDMYIAPNINDDTKFVELDEDGNVIDSSIKVIMVMYNTDALERYRYAEGTVVKSVGSAYHVKFTFETTDQINDDNKIKIKNVYMPGFPKSDNEESNYGYFTNNISANLYVLYKSSNGKQYGTHDLNGIVPEEELEGWTVTNMYSINGGLNFYYNYSQIISSIVSDTVVTNNYDGESGFLVKSVPVVRHSYMVPPPNAEEDDAYSDIDYEHNVQALINQFNYEKAYMDHAMELLENNFLIDFKLFNSYGKSRLYTLDKAGKKLVDRVNLTLEFEVKLLKTSDNNTKRYIESDIKQMIEDLNDLDSLHIPNLITTITNTYRNSIEYIEYLGINNYEFGAGIQHLYKHEDDDITAVPEFLCINVTPDMKPDIKINLV